MNLADALVDRGGTEPFGSAPASPICIRASRVQAGDLYLTGPADRSDERHVRCVVCGTRHVELAFDDASTTILRSTEFAWIRRPDG